MRTFVAVEIGPDARAAIQALVQPLRRSGADVSWVRVENLHVTLKFLGEITATQVDAIRGALPPVVAGFPAFAVRLAGTGGFPSLRRPRVLWVGITEGVEPLAALARAIDRTLAEQGFPAETRAFAPHLTVGRVRAPRQIDRLTSALTTASFAPELFPVQEVTFKQSTLRPTGAAYTTLSAFPLGGTTA